MKSLMNFSITQLNYVWAVHKHGHFGKAAEECHVTQPTLSMQIQKLEEDLGVVIFDRSKKPVLLTDSGKKLIEQIQIILNEAKKIERIIESSSTNKIEGDLRIGIIPTIAPYILPKLLPIIQRELPGLRLIIREMQTHRIIEALGNDEIDAGLLATPLKIPRVIEFPLYYEPFQILCQKKHALAKQKKVKYSLLKFDDLWLLEEGHCLRHQVMDICSIKDTRKFSSPYQFESGSLETIKNIVDSYGGYTLLPMLAQDNIGSHCTLIDFERPIPSRQIGLVYQREHYKNDLIESLGDGILKSIPESIRKIRPKDLDVIPVS